MKPGPTWLDENVDEESDEGKPDVPGPLEEPEPDSKTVYKPRYRFRDWVMGG